MEHPLCLCHPCLDNVDGDTITIFNDPVELRINGRVAEPLSGTGTIYYDSRYDYWPRIDWLGDIPTELHPTLMGFTNTEPASFDFIANGESIIAASPYGSHTLRYDGKKSTVTRVLHSGATAKAAGQESLYLLVHNLGDIRGVPVRNEQGASWSARHVFSFGEWQTTLDSIAKSQREREYGPCYVAKATHPRLARLEHSEVVTFLKELRAFLTLIQGTKPEIYAPVLVDGDDRVLAALTEGCSATTRRTGTCLCWPVEPSYDLESLAKSFHEEWTSSELVLKSTLDWRSKAYRAPGDPKEQLVSGCVGLEMLAYESLVSSSVMGDGAFRKMPIGDALSIALRIAGVDAETPDRFEEFRKAAKAENWPSAAFGLFRIRNRLVHPGGKSAKPVEANLLQEGLLLVRYYLDQLVFAQLGMEGHLRYPFVRS